MNLEKIYKRIAESKYHSTNGVVIHDSKKPGPTLGITICTHGNEPSGLYVVDFLEAYFKKYSLIKGKIIIVLNNLEATKKYLKLRYEDKIEDIQTLSTQSRFVDVNMNRLPADTMDEKTTSINEINRSRELSPLWNLFDVALDIHSTSQESPPMIIATKRYDHSLVSGFPIEIIISNIENIQIGKPAFSFYGSKDKKISSFAIESGSHNSEQSYACATACVRALLSSLQIISDRAQISNPVKQKEFYVINSVLFPDRSYELVRIFENFTKIEKGELVAKSSNSLPDIRSPESGLVLFAPIGTVPYNYAEEVFFITDIPK